MSLPLSLESIKAVVDERISMMLKVREREAGKIHPSYEKLWNDIDKTVMAGGKRLRPYLTIVGYGRVDEKIIPVAIAQEFVHAAMLMHDDIIDQDFVRHGQYNISGRYRDSYQQFVDNERATHYAHGIGILAGDLLISEAFGLLYKADVKQEVVRTLVKQLRTSIFEVVGGEFMDIEAGFVTKVSYDPLQIYRYKTASYSFVGPLLTGAYCRGAAQEEIHILQDFAVHVGIAYQLQDDLLGVFGDENQTGKSSLTDLRESKQTMLVKFHESLMNDQHRKHFDVFGDTSASNHDLEMIKEDMIDSGARQKTAGMMNEYFDKAIKDLSALYDDDRRAWMEDVTHKIRERNK